MSRPEKGSLRLARAPGVRMASPPPREAPAVRDDAPDHGAAEVRPARERFGLGQLVLAAFAIGGALRGSVAVAEPAQAISQMQDQTPQAADAVRAVDLGRDAVRIKAAALAVDEADLTDALVAAQETGAEVTLTLNISVSGDQAGKVLDALRDAGAEPDTAGVWHFLGQAGDVLEKAGVLLIGWQAGRALFGFGRAVLREGGADTGEMVVEGNVSGEPVDPPEGYKSMGDLGKDLKALGAGLKLLD